MGFFDRFISLRKDTAEYHLQQGKDFYLGSMGFKEAVEEFSEAIELDHDLVDAYFHRGMGYYFLSEYELAINDFDQTLRLMPQYTDVKYWRETAFSEQQHEKLERQLLLEYKKGDAVAPTDVIGILQRTICSIEVTSEYRSRLVFKDLQCGGLKNNDFTFIEWYFDFVRPDSFNVTQISSTEDIDRWTSIGNHQTRMAYFLSTRSERSSHSTEIESLLRIDKYLDFLKISDTENLAIELIDEGSFYFIQTALPRVSNLGVWPITQFRNRLAESLFHLMGHIQEDGNTIHWWLVPTIGETATPRSIAVSQNVSIVEEGLITVLKLWIRTDDYQLVKAQMEIVGELENSEKVSFVLQQVFGDYHNDIQILEPPE